MAARSTSNRPAPTPRRPPARMAVVSATAVTPQKPRRWTRRLIRSPSTNSPLPEDINDLLKTIQVSVLAMGAPRCRVSELASLGEFHRSHFADRFDEFAE